jgi:hypothetical protein
VSRVVRRQDVLAKRLVVFGKVEILSASSVPVVRRCSRIVFDIVVFASAG